MVERQEMEKVKDAVVSNDPGKTAAILGGLVAALPVAYGIGRGGLHISNLVNEAGGISNLTRPGNIFGRPLQPGDEGYYDAHPGAYQPNETSGAGRFGPNEPIQMFEP